MYVNYFHLLSWGFNPNNLETNQVNRYAVFGRASVLKKIVIQKLEQERGLGFPPYAACGGLLCVQLTDDKLQIQKHLINCQDQDCLQLFNVSQNTFQALCFISCVKVSNLSEQFSPCTIFTVHVRIIVLFTVLQDQCIDWI